MSQLPSFFEFTHLGEEEQYDVTFKNGDFVGTSEKGNKKFVLYKLNNFFVEIIYDIERNSIISLTAFFNPKK
ncbi:hypothetical protein [Chryseobacterium lacus]|uniref:hypothetical protein n=1 Tax=Chryseobacterium lacus TaxID=2058346 RepID=UPI000F87A2F2|nr:hypothetical protein [Chryseobacterium lacus]RST26233.1 hypothetical protein EIZ46_06830 [Chryseobacterium lacus]